MRPLVDRSATALSRGTPARIELRVVPSTEALAPLRRAVAEALDEIGVECDDAIVVTNEIVGALATAQGDGADDRSLDVTISRRGAELTVVVAGRSSPEQTAVLSGLRREIIEALAADSDHRVLLDDQQVVCSFELGTDLDRNGLPADGPHRP